MEAVTPLRTVRVIEDQPHAKVLLLLTPAARQAATVYVMQEYGECVWTAPDLTYARYAGLVVG